MERPNRHERRAAAARGEAVAEPFNGLDVARGAESLRTLRLVRPGEKKPAAEPELAPMRQGVGMRDGIRLVKKGA
jgi:hypothetical protein